MDGEIQGRSRQLRHLERALAEVKNWRLAIDVGAHSGHWSRRMSDRFEKVVAFEPMHKPARRWRERMADRKNARLHVMAIGDHNGMAEMVPGAKVGIKAKPHIEYATGGMTTVGTIDGFGFANVDLIKIDVEGAEALVLRGAAQTIKRDRPVIIIENIAEFQALYGGDRVTDIMTEFGARLVAELFPDQVWVFDGL